METGYDMVEGGFNGGEVKGGMVECGDCLVERGGREEERVERLKGGVELMWIGCRRERRRNGG